MKFVTTRPFNDPDAAARKLLEIANATEPAQDGRIYRASQRRLPKGRPHGRAVPRRYPEGSRQRLDGAARIRDLSEIHGCGSGAVRLTLTAKP